MDVVFQAVGCYKAQGMQRSVVDQRLRNRIEAGGVGAQRTAGGEVEAWPCGLLLVER